MIVVPIRTGRGLNNREHFAVRAKRVKAERRAVAWLLKNQERPAIPCTVMLTRAAPSGGVDDDNLSGSLKSVRDEVAKWLGVDDKDSATVRYVYAQIIGPWHVRIEFGGPASGAQLVLGLPALLPATP